MVVLVFPGDVVADEEMVVCEGFRYDGDIVSVVWCLFGVIGIPLGLYHSYSLHPW